MTNYKLQDKFLDKFFNENFASDFYLTGGTALSRFYFNHRISDDLDFFTQNQEIDFSKVNALVLRVLNDLSLKIIKQVNTDTFLQYITENGDGDTLKIDFVKEIPIHFGKFKTEGDIRIDSIENIGSNKILTVFGRQDAKDFIDLYYILNKLPQVNSCYKTKLEFEYLYNLASQKDLGLTKFYLANSMKNIEEITIYPKMLEYFDKEKMIEFYRNLSEKLLKEIKPD